MKRLSYCVLSSFVLGLAFLGPVGANPKQDPPRTVQDDANFFSTEAKAKANEVIATIKHTYGKDLMIDVVALKVPDGEEQSKFVDKRAVERFKNYHIDGIMVAIFTNQHEYRIEVGPETAKKDFTADNQAALRKILAGHLKHKDHDKALLDTVEYVLAVEKKHHPEKALVTGPHGTAAGSGSGHQVNGAGNATREAAPINWPLWIGIGIGALLLLWLIMGIARAAAGPRPGYGGGPGMGGGGGGYGYGGGGGGGFFPSLLGGLFGAAAGMWMYSHFFGGQSASYPSSYPGASGTAGDPGAASQASDVGAGDPVSSGGRWDDSGDNETGGDANTGGDDWRGGGDDAGGGDAGGGDWGGGGGDSGGGDWGGGGGGDTGGGEWGGGGGGDWGGGGGGDFGGGGGGDW